MWQFLVGPKQFAPENVSSVLASLNHRLSKIKELMTRHELYYFIKWGREVTRK
jgi:hypothetical protein